MYQFVYWCEYQNKVFILVTAAITLWCFMVTVDF